MDDQQKASSNITLIPHGLDASSSEFQSIVKNYKTSRLAALQSDPAAFSSTYERESQFGDEVWTSRIRNPLSKTFIALETPVTLTHDEIRETQETTESAVGKLLNHTWLGQLVLLGPVPVLEGREDLEHAPWKVFDGIDFVDVAGKPVPGDAHLVYTLVGMFVQREARRSGKGAELVRASLREMEEERTRLSARKATVVIVVNPENHGAIRLYERCGFVTREEAGGFFGFEEGMRTMTRVFT